MCPGMGFHRRHPPILAIDIEAARASATTRTTPFGHDQLRGKLPNSSTVMLNICWVKCKLPDLDIRSEQRTTRVLLETLALYELHPNGKPRSRLFF